MMKLETETPVRRRDVVQVLAALDEDEFRILVAEARGVPLVPAEGVTRGSK